MAVATILVLLDAYSSWAFSSSSRNSLLPWVSNNFLIKWNFEDKCFFLSAKTCYREDCLQQISQSTDQGEEGFAAAAAFICSVNSSAQVSLTLQMSRLFSTHKIYLMSQT